MQHYFAVVCLLSGDHSNMAGDQCLTFTDVMQVFKALKRYSGLLCRPAIAAALQDELLAVVQQIDQYLDSIQSSFEQRAQVCPHNQYVASHHDTVNS